MTCLLRARGSALEMARLFAAQADASLIWPESIWPGEPVPVVVQTDDGRRLTTMNWDLPSEAFACAIPPRQRGTIYPRDFWRDGSRLVDVASLSRCLTGKPRAGLCK